MKDYEGPVFKNGSKQIEKRHFKHPAIRIDSGKSKFEPAYKVKQTKADRLDAKSSQGSHDGVDQSEAQFETTKQSEPKSGLQHYEIPFLKNKNKSSQQLNSFKNPVDSKASGDKIDVASPEKVYNGQTGRTSYEPTYKQKAKEEASRKTFKATELPKTFIASDKSNQKIDENTRLLARRLQKSKDSFLLFDK